MSDYVIKGQTSDADARLVVINESDWSVEVDENPIVNYVPGTGLYYTEVTNSKKLVFVRRTTGQVKAYGNVDPIEFWDEKTSDTYWENNTSYSPTFTWNGSAWVADNSGSGTYSVAALKAPIPVQGQWNYGYRPLYAKVEYSLSGGGDVEDMGFVGSNIGSAGRGTSSSAPNSLVESIASGEGMLLTPIWDGRDFFYGLNVRIPAGEILTISGIYFSKTHFTDDVCDGFAYGSTAFEYASTLSGTEPNFTGTLEIMGTNSTGSTSYDYSAASFTVTSIDTLNIKVESSTPQNPPRVSIFDDEGDPLIGDNNAGLNWNKSGTELVDFDWTPPSAGTYTLVVKNDSNLGAGNECDNFVVTISGAAGEEEPGTECEGYETMAAAISNVVSGTLSTEQTWSVDAESYYGMYYGDGSDLGGPVNIDASASTSFAVNFMGQTYGDLVTNATGDFYWDIEGVYEETQGTKNGSGSSATWTTALLGPDTYELRIDARNGTDGADWVDGFEPDKVKVTFTGAATVDNMIVAGNNGSLCDAENYVSGTEVILSNWDGGGEGGNIIERFIVFASTSITVTKIEFISVGAGSLEWTVASGINSSNNGGTQEVVAELNPTSDWRIVLHNAQTSCVDIDMTVTHSGSTGSWDDRTSNTYWGVDTGGSWTGSGWDATSYYGGNAVGLSSQTGTDSGAWTSGYQPTQIKLTWTGDDPDYISMSMYDGGGSLEGLQNGVPMPIANFFAHPGDYIYSLFVASYGGDFVLTGIEFSFEAYEYPCQTGDYIEGPGGVLYSGAMYQNADWSIEHLMTVQDTKYGAIGFTNAYPMGYTRLYVVNEDNSATGGFEVSVWDANGQQGYSTTTGDTIDDIYIDGGAMAFGDFYVVIYNSGGVACEEFSINMETGY